jgi:hypothetical protein
MIHFKQYKWVLTFFLIVVSAALFAEGCAGKYPSEWGKRLQYGDCKLFYTPLVTEEKARKLGDYLVETGFFKKGNAGTVQITKEGDLYQFRMVVKEGVGDDTEFLKAVGMFAAHLSRNVFDNEMLEIHLCDKQFKTLQTVGFEITDSQDETE